MRKHRLRGTAGGDGRSWRLRSLTALVLSCGLLANAGAQEASSGKLPGTPEPVSAPAAERPSNNAIPAPSDEVPSEAAPRQVSQETGTASGPPAPSGTTLAPPLSPAEEQDIAETVYGSISRGFLGTATWLDSFFGDERYEAEVNRSQLKVRFDAFREGDTGMDYRRPNFDLRLVLPQLRKKTRLVIAGDPTVDEDAATALPTTTPASQPLPPGGTGKITTALQYFPVETLRSNFSVRAGVKLSEGKVQLLLGPRYRYLVPLGPWALRLTQEVTWTTDVGWQSRTRFDYERAFPRDLFFRSSIQGLWTENVNGYPYDVIFLLRQPLDSSRALEYEWINSFQTRPTNILVQELLVFRYRQRFWKDWLFLEIDPQLRFPRDQSFAFTPGILFRLELIFGQYGPLF